MNTHYICDNYSRTWECHFEGWVDLEEQVLGDRETGTFFGECPHCGVEIRVDRDGVSV